MTPASVKDSPRAWPAPVLPPARSPAATSPPVRLSNSIGLDMGGTSTDVSLAYDGQSRITKDWYIDFGYPIRFPSIEVLTIGAGGGSLGLDRPGRLAAQRPAVGRALPGPACYGNGDPRRPVPTPTSRSVASAPVSPVAR